MSKATGRSRQKSAPGRPRCIVFMVVVAVGLPLAAVPVPAATCEDAATVSEVKAALAEVEASVDPCGDSAEVVGVVREFRHCASRGYRVCLNLESERNFIEPGVKSAGLPTTITWNPELRTELEHSCGGSLQGPVRRDPVASLLHEVVHAVQDCHGLDPADHEFEAVRIENIYRRARGLCQRTRYGEQALPAGMIVTCEPGDCSCRPADHLLESTARNDHAPATVLGLDAAGDVAAAPPSGER